MTGSKGRIVMPFTETVSVWASRMMRRFGSRPGKRAMRFGRPGKTSVSHVSMPRPRQNSPNQATTPASETPPS
jgi:hypothetical protein